MSCSGRARNQRFSSISISNINLTDFFDILNTFHFQLRRDMEPSYTFSSAPGVVVLSCLSCSSHILFHFIFSHFISSSPGHKTIEFTHAI